MAASNKQLRVAFIVGSLYQGGAEKQFLYILEALRRKGVQTRICALSQGEFYETILKQKGFEPEWVGNGNPLLRSFRIAQMLRSFQPHIIQSTHFFSNLYAALSGWMLRTVSVGSIRSDAYNEIKKEGAWGPWLVRLPSAIIANSYAAYQNLKSQGYPYQKVHVLPNVIDLSAFEKAAQAANQAHLESDLTQPDQVQVITVGRLVKAKRLDIFLQVLALARKTNPRIHGIVVGNGPERAFLEKTAEELGLLSDGVVFTGRRNDVPHLLKSADILMLTSSHEGFPNVLLEGMAAGLPIITTPAGDAPIIVQEGVTGYICDFEDIEGMAQRLLKLTSSTEARLSVGQAGAARVKQKYSADSLDQQLLNTYRDIGTASGNRVLLNAIAQQPAARIDQPRESLH